MDARDILSMPDPWEYPWFAAWDLAFHTVALAHLDPAFAKYQLLALCREWFQHPNGALPAYEWAFGDANPPVHAWAALHVWDIDGRRDHDFLARLLPKLLMNFTWWVNRMDPEGNHLFAGGFLGLDNISAIDRSHLPAGRAPGAGRRHELDGVLLADPAGDGQDPGRARTTAWTDIEVKFIEHFVLIVDAMHSQGLWDEEDGFFYDVFHASDGTTSRSRSGPSSACCPLLGMVVLGPELLETLGTLQKRFAGFLGQDDPAPRRPHGRVVPVPDSGRRSRSASSRRGRGPPRPGPSLRRERVPLAVRAPRACRSTTRTTRCGSTWPGSHVSVDYEPAESTHRHVRRQLQLARAGVDAGQLPRAAQPAALRPIARRDGRDRVPHRQRPDASRWPTAPTTCGGG